MADKEFTCSGCHGTFLTQTTNEDLEKEKEKILKSLTGFKEISKDKFNKAMTDEILYGTGIVTIHTIKGDIKIEHTPFTEILKNE